MGATRLADGGTPGLVNVSTPPLLGCSCHVHTSPALAGGYSPLSTALAIDVTAYWITIMLAVWFAGRPGVSVERGANRVEAYGQEPIKELVDEFDPDHL